MDFPPTNDLNRIEKVCNWKILEGGTLCDTQSTWGVNEGVMEQRLLALIDHYFNGIFSWTPRIWKPCDKQTQFSRLLIKCKNLEVRREERSEATQASNGLMNEFAQSLSTTFCIAAVSTASSAGLCDCEHDLELEPQKSLLRKIYTTISLTTWENSRRPILCGREGAIQT